MKGLFLKDIYTLIGYQKAMLILELVWILVVAAFDMDGFLAVYPCLFPALYAVSLIAYDERERWETFSWTLPVTRGEIVTVKYAVCLAFGVATAALASFPRIFIRSMQGRGAFLPLAEHFLMLLSISLISAAVVLPFIYKFGAERGRLAYSIVLGVSCAVFSVAANAGFLKLDATSDMSPPSFIIISLPRVVIIIPALILFALSWMLSKKFYAGRLG